MRLLAILLTLMMVVSASETIWTTPTTKAEIDLNIYGNKIVSITSNASDIMLCHREVIDRGVGTHTNPYAWGDKMSLPPNSTIYITALPGNNLFYCTDGGMTMMLTPAVSVSGYAEDPWLIIGFALLFLYILLGLFRRKNWPLTIGAAVVLTIGPLLTIPESPLTSIFIWTPAIVIADALIGFIIKALGGWREVRI